MTEAAKPMVQDAIRRVTEELDVAGVDNPALDARILVAHALGCARLELLTQAERPLTPAEIEKIQSLAARRARREPVARILGLREFWGLPFGLNEATLEPRPDSETLVEAALSGIGDRGLGIRILDLGTGTGCLLLALLHELPEASGLGVDIAPRAAEQARQNAERLGLQNRVEFRIGDWLEGINEKFDLIISNPPYVATPDIPNLMPEVRGHDPLAALDGGADGLDVYRLLIPKLPLFLNPNGLAVFEVGQGQAGTVSNLFRNAGFADIATHKDLGGITRCIRATNSGGF
ncbi:MAG: peptide chain release factor N(5)-glutamine methyltransferase [Alphaproteobacteria bacterium]|nr:peptide chain release factor N(5)-glutamine methyltransferase [Alphaproteobacteria bacterium]